VRYHEISAGFRLPVSGEEQAMLNKIGKKGLPIKDLIDEREQEVARVMMTRGLLDRKRDKDGQVFYHINSIHDIWMGR
jgi:hypothetical protein